MSARAEQAPSGYAAVGTMSERMGSDELIAVFSEGDGYASRALVEDVELAYECADDATFEHILPYIREGVTEREIALEIEFYMRKLGAEIKVPLFIDEGEMIRIDTRTGEYMERA